MAKPESDGSYVTIPYFLYEAMARAYYGRVAGDFPVTRPIASDFMSTEAILRAGQVIQ